MSNMIEIEAYVWWRHPSDGLGAWWEWRDEPRTVTFSSKSVVPYFENETWNMGSAKNENNVSMWIFELSNGERLAVTAEVKDYILEQSGMEQP